ncbi:penicillin acylase family protein [Crossiella sp. SN42]|uniref:penicillin acylase family protein n=1 Tax=Crossiella sp. SN42 TaxID=2944808 RepID=UPI00207C7F9C|nr:penicillin acylase family protein [Crossiella sp. SN42]MCO1579933.1 penicillin acylase family protein [Crossiella sp. SN42]
MRGKRKGALLLAGVLAAGVIGPSALAEPAVARNTTTFQIAGLTAPVRTVLDKWGVPHIYATNTADVYLGQGFNAARDRLFQLDLWRRRGLGTLSEALGGVYADLDKGARAMLYRGDLAKEWAAYPPQAKEVATKFVAGVNGYIEWLERHPESLPEEFKVLGHRPARWQPEDVVRIRHHALVTNAYYEALRALTTCAAGPEADAIRQNLEPKHAVTVPQGLDTCALAQVVEPLLTAYGNAVLPVTFDAGTGKISTTQKPPAQGSNNWAISAAKSATGRPVLADDPHRLMSLPASRYLAHLSAPGLDIIGAGEPMIPGLSLGHNGTSAFGLTMFPADQEDLYVYELDPADHSRYKYGNGYEAFRTVTEKLAVKGEQPRDLTTSFSRHGPILFVDAQRHLAYGLRSVWLEPGTSPYFAALGYQNAKTAEQFGEALKKWRAPGANHVYANTAGQIGWLPGALVPKRPKHDGLLPVPGDGRYEWNGFYSGDDLPRTINPASGWVATGNEMNVPASHQNLGLGYDSWSDPYRYQRIAEVLNSKAKLSFEDSLKLQNDFLSIPARKITGVLKSLSSEDPKVKASLALLTGWNHVAGPESAAAALYEPWFTKHLGPKFIQAVLPGVDFIQRPDTQVLIDALEHPENYFGADGKAKRDKLLIDTLVSARAEVEKLLGADQASWQWGKLQHTKFENPVSPLVDEATRKRLNVGPFPRGGASDTVNNSEYESADFRHIGGASLRVVIDVGNWDGSKAVNAPGQSGNPADPHYKDLAETWRKGEYFPLVYSKVAVERNAERYLILVPKSS